MRVTTKRCLTAHSNSTALSRSIGRPLPLTPNQSWRETFEANENNYSRRNADRRPRNTTQLLRNNTTRHREVTVNYGLLFMSPLQQHNALAGSLGQQWLREQRAFQWIIHTFLSTLQVLLIGRCLTTYTFPKYLLGCPRHEWERERAHASRGAKEQASLWEHLDATKRKTSHT